MAAIRALIDSFAQLRTRMDKAGRGLPQDAYGSQMPLNQLANVSAPEWLANLK